MIQKAIIAKRNEDMGLNATSKIDDVSKAYLKRRLDVDNINATHHVQIF
jgi:hypothetical protein